MMNTRTIIPASAVIPTMNRTPILVRTLKSLFDQNVVPQSVIVIDASSNDETKTALEAIETPGGVSIVYRRAVIKGAAQQRNQAVRLNTLPYVIFMDDDVILEQNCIERIYAGFSLGPNVGGVNAMITNQKYSRLGRITTTMCRLFDGNKTTWAGRVVGPAWNFLPDDDPSLPEYVQCDWLNLGATMYRADALPDPVFPEIFHGYSAFEDMTLSLNVGKKWTLLNARTARLFHDTQPGDYKNKIARLTEMEVVNRHYIMTKVLGRKGIKDYAKLFLFEGFNITSFFTSAERMRLLPGAIAGKIKGYFKIAFK